MIGLRKQEEDMDENRKNGSNEVQPITKGENGRGWKC